MQKKSDSDSSLYASGDQELKDATGCNMITIRMQIYFETSMTYDNTTHQLNESNV